MQKSLSRYWLLLGVFALGIAGLYSLVLVVARTPQLSDIPIFARLFHEALVVHVDLSVLVWFLAIACLMWSLLCEGARTVFPLLEEAALVCFAGGTLLIAAAPFDAKSVPLMSNYIPVIMSPVFFLGLALLLCGLGLMLVKLFTSSVVPPTLTLPHTGGGDIRFGIYSAGLITLVALACFFWSYMQMPPGIDGQQYYDMLFWGGGHVLQFTHVQMLLVCWLIVAAALEKNSVEMRYLYALFSIGLIAAFTASIPYIFYDVASQAHRLFFTDLMIAVNGIAPMVIAFCLLLSLWKMRARRSALWSCLLMSVLLFLYGGWLGEMISGENTGVPAHYHGSIVGVTLAFMGIAYMLLPRFGYRDVTGWRLSYWQPFVYGAGQFMHISGLAWSGGYGVLRKTPGGLDALPTNVKIAMGIMGLGGTLAIIGGFMFIIAVAVAVFGRPKPSV